MSDMKLVQLVPPPKTKPSQILIDELERLLERARSGDIIGGALAVIDASGISEYHIVGYSEGFALVGAATCMQAKLTDIANQSAHDLSD